MKITQTSSGASIDFGNTMKKKVKVLFIFEAVFYIGISLGCFGFLVSKISEEIDISNNPYGAKYSLAASTIIAFVMAAIAGVFFFYAFLRFLTRITTSEKLFITRDFIEITTVSLFRKKSEKYELEGITFLYYKGAPGKTDHPLKGKSFDYFGFETQEALIGSVHSDGNIGFLYEGKKVSFARDIYSWDAEKISKVFQEATDSQLVIDNIPAEITDWSNSEG